MKTSLIIVITAGLISAALIIGCAGPDRVATDYGVSYNNAKYGQILDPEAERNLEPVERMGGPVAQTVVEKYKRGFGKGAADSNGSGYAISPGMSAPTVGTPDR